MSARVKPREAVSGSYTPVPHALLDSAAFLGCSDRAKAMLFELLRQHNGRNNGRHQLAVGWLRKERGWKSTRKIQQAKVELIDRGLIVKTRYGGLNAGPDLYALTWLPISDYRGLDIKVGSYHPGQWRMLDPLPVMTKRTTHSAGENGAVPRLGMVVSPPVPPVGTKTPVSEVPTVPPVGNNECCQFPSVENHCRIVGKKGRSGVRTATVTEQEGSNTHVEP